MLKGRVLLALNNNERVAKLIAQLTEVHYEVIHVNSGAQAWAYFQQKQKLPHFIMSEIDLPEMDGLTLCRNVKMATRISHIPFILLSDKPKEADADKSGLGPDYYLSQPFDIEVFSRIDRERLMKYVGEQKSVTGLPSGRFAEQRMRELLQQNVPWTFIDLRIKDFKPYWELYGLVAGDEVLRFTAQVLKDAVAAAGTKEDYLAHPGSDNFVLLTLAADVQSLVNTVIERFSDEIKPFYLSADRQRGYSLGDFGGKEVRADFMTLLVGMVSSTERQFTDIREITELARERRGHDGEPPPTQLTTW